MVASTIAVIVVSYFSIHHEATLLYICDSSDGKQAARKRKFDNWFLHFSQDEFKKYDFPITDLKDGVTYYNTIMLKTGNPDRHQIIAEFESIFGSCNNPK